MEHTKAFVLTSWALRLIVAVILLQASFFKFTAAKESVYIFSTLGWSHGVALAPAPLRSWRVSS